MKTHELKIRPTYFKQIKAGIKNWELRFNDREFSIGDKAILHEWNGEYTGRRVNRLIVGIFTNTETITALLPGWVILSLTTLDRTSRQNRYYWSQMERLACEIPEVVRTAVGWHELLKQQILGIKEIRVGDLEIPFSTSWLSIEDFNWYLRQANDWVFRRHGVEFEDAVIYKYRE